jgi:hypothetical protein
MNRKLSANNIKPLIMKKEWSTAYPELKKEELQQLCSIVKETLATGIILPQAKEKKTSFGSADLWNLHRKMNTAGRRWNSIFRFYFVRR